MRYETLDELLRTVVQDHKRGIRFFSGAESDFDPANADIYPAILASYSATQDQDFTTANFSNGWNVTFAYHDLFEMDRDAAETTEKLGTIYETLTQIIYKVMELGNGTDFTANNITERLCFKLSAPAAYNRFIDEGQNNTIGWQVFFTLNEQLNYDACCADGAFNTL